MKRERVCVIYTLYDKNSNDWKPNNDMTSEWGEGRRYEINDIVWNIWYD